VNHYYPEGHFADAYNDGNRMKREDRSFRAVSFVPERKGRKSKPATSHGKTRPAADSMQ
jgi:hypothetical protein